MELIAISFQHHLAVELPNCHRLSFQHSGLSIEHDLALELTNGKNPLRHIIRALRLEKAASPSIVEKSRHLLTMLHAFLGDWVSIEHCRSMEPDCHPVELANRSALEFIAIPFKHDSAVELSDRDCLSFVELSNCASMEPNNRSLPKQHCWSMERDCHPVELPNRSTLVVPNCT